MSKLLPWRLKPVDSFNDVIMAADKNYLYRIGYSGSGTLDRISKADPSQVTTLCSWASIEAGLVPQSAWRVLSSGIQLFAAKNGSGVNKIYRSLDGGATWSACLTLNQGETNPLGNRGMCVCVINGVESVLVGEYRTSWPNGTDNVSLYMTQDDGNSWTTLNTWQSQSAGGAIRHIHAVIQDPYTGMIYIGVGDTNAQSGIIRWDPTTTMSWASIGSTSPSAVTALGVPGFIGVGNQQKYRMTDMVFTASYAYNPTDSGSSNVADQGIYRVSKDLSSWVRVNSDEVGQADSGGYWALATSSGQLLFVDYVSGSAGLENELNIWAMREGGVCIKIAVINTQHINAVKNVLSLFEDDGKVYLSATPLGGKNTQKGTAVFVVDTSQVFLGPQLDIMWPVFWIAPAPTGSSANDGKTPRTPKALLGHTINNVSNAVDFGSCVMIAAGIYSEAAFTYGGWTSIYGKAFTADSTTDTVTLASHGIANNSQIWAYDYAGVLPGGLTSGNTYYAVNVTTNTFQVSLTSGGAAIDLTSNGTTGFTFTKFNVCKYGKPVHLRGAGGIATVNGVPTALDATLYQFTSGSNGLTRPNVAGTELWLMDLSIDLTTGAGNSIVIGNSGANWGKVGVQNCRLGSESSVVRAALEVKNDRMVCYRSMLGAGPAANGSFFGVIANIAAPGTECRAELYACVVGGGYDAIEQGNAGQVYVYHSVLRNYFGSAWEILSGASNLPTMFNSVCYSSGNSNAATPFRDSATQTYDSRNLNGNLLDKSSSARGVADAEIGARSSIVSNVGTAGVVYANPAANDFTPVYAAQAQERSPGQTYAFTITGEQFKNPGSIGPMEYAAGSRMTGASRAQGLARAR